MNDSLRVYLDPTEIGDDGYPFVWHRETRQPITGWENVPHPTIDNIVRSIGGELLAPAIKDTIRERDGHRCLRCLHPYTKGDGEWSACDEQCRHGGPVRRTEILAKNPPIYRPEDDVPVQEAQWRILTVHHLNGVKHDCRWWNLVSLCQRCHLTIQCKVRLERPWHGEHSDWFRPFAAGWYAFAHEGLELSREEVDARLEELLDLERFTNTLFGLDQVERRY